MARYLTHPEVGGALQVAFVGSMTRKQGTETRLKQGMETRRKLEQLPMWPGEMAAEEK